MFFVQARKNFSLQQYACPGVSSQTPFALVPTKLKPTKNAVLCSWAFGRIFFFYSKYGC